MRSAVFIARYAAFLWTDVMKTIFVTIILSCLLCATAYAQSPAPCPSQSPDEVKPVDPNEKCKPDFDKLKTAPVVFEFPDDSKKPADTPAPAEDEKKN